MTHPDLDALLDAILPAATDLLSKHGEFFPIGASMNSSGEIALAAGYTGEEHPPSQEVIDLLIDGFRRRADDGALRAAVVCFDALVLPPGQKDKSDAICARLEHESGEAVVVYLPYRKRRRGKFDFGELFATPGERAVF